MAKQRDSAYQSSESIGEIGLALLNTLRTGEWCQCATQHLPTAHLLLFVVVLCEISERLREMQETVALFRRTPQREKTSQREREREREIVGGITSIGGNTECEEVMV
jgi:hypothetical protein